MAPVKARGNVVVTYNSQNITQYCNQADLQTTLEEIETTNLASTGQESIAGNPTWTIALGGDWAAALDAILGVDAVTPAKRTASIAYTDGATTVTYTWTSKAEIGAYAIPSSVATTIKWTATLRLSGAPSRASA